MDRDLKTTSDTSKDFSSKDYSSSDYSGSGERQRRVLSASTLSGDRVRNSAGEDLGKIQDIMIDVSSGRVAYAVLSFGGFLGIGDKLFAVPWNALTVDEVNKEIVLDADKQMLENAPGFDKDNWPDFADPNWGSQIHSHYGREPYWSAPGSADEYIDEQEHTSESGASRGTKSSGREVL